MNSHYLEPEKINYLVWKGYCLEIGEIRPREVDGLVWRGNNGYNYHAEEEKRGEAIHLKETCRREAESS